MNLSLNSLISKDQFFKWNELLAKVSCLAFLGLFFIWQYIITLQNASTNLFIAHCLSGLILICLFTGMFKFLENFNQLTKYSKIFLGMTLGAWVIVLVLMYPGIFSFDFFNSIVPAMEGKTNSWFSHTYTSLLMVLGPLGPDFFAVSIFIFFLFGVLVFRLALHFPIYKIWFLLLMLLLFNHPLLYIFSYFVYRDSVVALLTAHAVLGLCLAFKTRKFEFWNLLVVMTAIYFCALIRSETALYIFVFPVMIFWLQRYFAISNFSWRLFLAPIVAFGLQTWAYDYTRTNSSPVYLLTTIWNPLNYILFMHKSEIAAADKEILGHVIEVEYLERNLDLFEISGFHNGRFKSYFSPEDKHSVFNVFFQLVLKYPMTFLENRWQMFLETNFGKNVNSVVDTAEKISDHPFANQIRNYLSPPFWNNSLKKWLLAEFEIISEKFMTRILFASTAPFILLYFCSLFFARYRMLNVVGLTPILFRSAAVFLTAPAAQIKYYGTFLFPLAILIYFNFWSHAVRKEQT